MAPSALPGRWAVSLRFLWLVLLGLAAPSWAGWLTQEQSIMGTEVKVTLWHPDSAVGEQAIAQVMAEMQRIDQAYSPYRPASELSQVNLNAAQTSVKVSPELAMLLERSLYFSELSGGAFDITFASLGWHYDYREHKQPNQQQKQTLLAAINYKWVELDSVTRLVRYLHPNVRIDLGGIAKGYAVDRAIEILRNAGIAHATVSAGGDSRLLGDKRGRPWLIGIKNPRAAAHAPDEVALTMPLDNLALSTSGDYERYFIDEHSGKRVHHILNPKTGESASELMSATVLGADAIATDALSTTVFVLGVDAGLALVNRLPEYDAILIDAGGRVHYSDGLTEPAVK